MIFLKLEKTLKQSFEVDKLSKIGFREETQKLFQPITESISEQNIVHKKELNALGDKVTSNQMKIYQKINQTIPAITAPKHIQVSKLIQSYLSDNDNRSTAGYSIKYNPTSNLYTIGNSDI